MMRAVYVAGDNILSPIGLTSRENFESLAKGETGIRLHENKALSPTPFQASLFGNDNSIRTDAPNHFTKFESLIVHSVDNALENTGIDLKDKKTVFIISSTKGNISLIEQAVFTQSLKQRIALHHSAQLIAEYFGYQEHPVVISNACISGLLAILTGLRLIQSGQYEHAVVTGGDVITKFILSGFQSFMAVSESPCKPFDADRDGITLGEGAATIILSSNKKYAGNIKIAGGAVTNDANHISGPSRTGEELALAIKRSLQQSDVPTTAIDFISAHGTATLYNDEMEAKAISLAQLSKVPVNSLKGNYGHTLGAAGLIEAVITVHSLSENLILPTRNFNHLGVSKPINICSILQKTELRNALKTASGFGGCNAALVFSK